MYIHVPWNVLHAYLIIIIIIINSYFLQEANQVVDSKSLPSILETDELPKKKLDRFYKPPTPELIAYLDFAVSTTGVLSGVKVKGEGGREIS